MDLGQHIDWDHLRANQVPQYQPRPHAGQLVVVSNDQQPGSLVQGVQHPAAQGRVAHRILVGNQQVAHQLIFLQTLVRVPQHPVDGGRLGPGQLLHPHGRLASGGADTDIHPRPQVLGRPHQDLQGLGLAGTGPAGEDGDRGEEGRPDGAPLLCGQCKAAHGGINGILDFGPGGEELFRRLHQLQETLGDVGLSHIVFVEVDRPALTQRAVDDDGPLPN